MEAEALFAHLKCDPDNGVSSKVAITFITQKAQLSSEEIKWQKNEKLNMYFLYPRLSPPFFFFCFSGAPSVE